MNENEKKLSDYIDSLNEEKRPLEHGSQIDNLEMEELFETVRLVRSLKEPALPEDGYTERLSNNVSARLLRKKKNPFKGWMIGAASIAAAVLIVFTMNFSKNNIVNATAQAFNNIKAYHGTMILTETNGEGKSAVQSKVEVWANKEGNYYVKELEGPEKNLITVNDGQRKWQIQPKTREVDVFNFFPDYYSFTFELGKEIESLKNAIDTKVTGSDTVAGREAFIVEVTPKGGSPYKIWIDKENKMPLQKQSAMEYGIQYKVRYLNIDFTDSIPKELLTYNIPSGFKEVKTNTEQIVNNVEEAQNIAGFLPRVPKNIPNTFTQGNIAVNDKKVVIINYTSQDNKERVLVLQKKAIGEFKPSSMAALGKVGNSKAEIQSPVENEEGILQGMGTYSSMTGINSIRWQENGFEYAVVGSTSLENLASFVKGVTVGTVELPSIGEQTPDKPQVKVPVDLKAEEGDQKNADSGHSPWKLDPVFVAQVFVSLKMSPGGIQGDYPIKYEELKVVKNDGKEAVVEAGGNKTPIRRVYLKRLIRQDNTGIWTVVGYDPAK